MQEFLLKNYSILTHLVESMATLTGVIFFEFYKKTKVKYFIYFLVYLTFCEFFGSYANYTDDNDFFSFLQGTVFASNHWFYTVFWYIGAVVFFAFYYSKILKTVLFRCIVEICGVSFLLISVVYIVCHWSDFFKMFFPIISILGAIVILICTILYFIEVLQSDAVLTFYKLVDFYISAAIFVWWIIITPLVFYDMYHSNGDWDFIFLKREIYLFANIFMYSMFTFALIYCRYKQKQC